MKKNSLFFSIVFFTAFFSFMISLIIGVVMMLLGDMSEIAFIFGLVGLVGFLFMFLGIYLHRRKTPKKDKKDIEHSYYISLVEKAEENPKAFDRKLRRLTYLGNAYIALLFIFIISSIAGLIMIGVKTGWSMGGFGILGAGLVGAAYVVVKSIYIKPEEITGNTISKDEYPNIYQVIDNARAKTNASKLHKVFIYPDANCGVLCRTVGFGFKTQNIMYIGLDLLKTLDNQELEAILIHEFAHIYNKDTLLSNKINKNILRWDKIAERCDEKGIIANLLLKNFSRFYITKMQLHLAAISKQKEYIADFEAAKYMGKELYSKAITKIYLLQYFFDKQPEENGLDLRAFEVVPENFYNILFDEFYKQYNENKDIWLNQIVKRISTKYDSHPSFCERMIKIGIDDFTFHISFDHLNESCQQEINELVFRFNKEWHDGMLENWDEFCGDYKKSIEVVNTYTKTDNLEKNCEYGLALEYLSRFDEALALYNELIDICPNNEILWFRKGILLLNHNNENGIEFIKKAMEKNNDYIIVGLQNIAEFLNSNGMKDKKGELSSWAEEMAGIARKKQDEIDYLRIDDIFVNVNIDEEKRLKIKQKLSVIDSVNRAFLVTKKLKYSSAEILVLAVLSKGNKLKNIDELIEILEEAGIPYFLLDLNANTNFVKIMALIKDSEIYRRAK